ncbi:Metallo-dependent phosphatase [Aaosphaeria arxii CBS 175.79]|uniref:Purple acid phosphatase n=1 Tax=Aaosphaeria arxii CBS 175.79 TaxID=1450172 RepID=A0A6A5Y4B0_9PLEO|nr:Metallo-dependent phosphatase [Aaosphaeria arxii CBS 175.79]KAF2020392.1 Metallo-dependent phosphatase [Aaosphaeria arxii CBS 175.79]
MNNQIRLAYAGSTGMFISWNTFKQISNPTVHYGLSANSLNMSSSSNVSITYPTSLTYNNHVKLSGLKPDTLYYYSPEQLINTTYTAPLTFKTSRIAGTSKEFSVAVVIDMGTMGSKGLTTSAGKGISPNNILQQGETNTIESLAQHADAFDFMWHPGDIAYADYWLKEEIQGFLPNTTIEEGIKVYESILNDYYNELASVSAFKPYMVGPGNHESNCDNGGTTDKRYNYTYTSDICMPGQTNFTGYKNHFRMPSTESGGTGNFWYSFDNGMTHFIQLDTETDLGHGFIGPDEVGGSEGQGSGPFNITMDAQTTWLEADLKAINRSITPWIVVAGHRPWYLSHTNNSGTICWTCKDVFEPLLIKYNVDLVISGHAHVYERQAPLANGVVDKAELNNPISPWYITNGMGGHYDGLDALQDPRQNYSRYGLDTSNATYAWSKLTFHNCTHMSHDLIASKNGSVVDHSTLGSFLYEESDQ